MKWLRRIAITLGVALVVVYLAGMAAMYVLQRSFQYEPGAEVLPLSQTALAGAELVTIPTGGGATLTGWYQPPEAGRPLIIYYKGNADNYTAEHIRYEAFTADGYGFLAFDYRGFPASPGAINQANILEDALSVFDWVKAKDYPIVIWGRSLGSGPATYVASQREADALLLETPFDSALSVGQERYWFFPVNLLMLDQFPVDSWIADVSEPVLVALGTADKTIPYHHGQRVYDLAPNKYDEWIVEGAGHSDLWKAGIWEQAKPFYAAAETALGR